MKYFNNPTTLEELRKQYKELLKKYHPDNPNGSTEATQEVNAEYDTLFKTLNRHNTTTDKYDFEVDEKLREALQQIIHISDIDIEICTGRGRIHVPCEPYRAVERLIERSVA